MIRHIILYEDPSGKTLLNVHIKPAIIKQDKVDLIGGFFVALSHFSLEAFENNVGIMDYVKFLNHSVRFLPIYKNENNSGCSMLVIYDEVENFDIFEFSKKIIKLCVKNLDLFLEQEKDCNVAHLYPLIRPILTFMRIENGNLARANSSS